VILQSFGGITSHNPHDIALEACSPPRMPRELGLCVAPQRRCLAESGCRPIQATATTRGHAARHDTGGPYRPWSIQSRVRRAFRRAGPDAQPVRGALVRGLRTRPAAHLRYRARQLQRECVHPDEARGPRIDGDVAAIRRWRRKRNPHGRGEKALRNSSRSSTARWTRHNEPQRSVLAGSTGMAAKSSLTSVACCRRAGFGFPSRVSLSSCASIS
jgi:hypothetical protein